MKMLKISPNMFNNQLITHDFWLQNTLCRVHVGGCWGKIWGLVIVGKAKIPRSWHLKSAFKIKKWNRHFQPLSLLTVTFQLNGSIYTCTMIKIIFEQRRIKQDHRALLNTRVFIHYFKTFINLHTFSYNSCNF